MGNEEELLRSAALQNAKDILLAQEKAEQALLRTKEALERKTEELAHTLEMMRATLEATTDGILVIDEAGKVSSFNKRFLEIWSLTPEMMAGMEIGSLQDLVSKQLLKPLVKGREAPDASVPARFDLLELSDGRVFERLSQVRRVQNREVGQVWSFRDVTERRRTEETQSRLAAVVESSDDAIVTKTLDGTITTWNMGAQRLFGYTAEEIIGRPVWVLIPPNLQDEEPRIIERLQRGERIEHYETVRRRKDGTTFNVSLTVSPLKDSHGKVIGASKIARDITERKQVEEVLRREAQTADERREELERLVDERTASLREAVAQMEEFSYSVSHDLRAPLRAMQAYAGALLEDYGTKLDAEGQEYLQRIVRAGLRMDRLTQDVLTYSKIPRTALLMERVSLDKVLAEIIQQYVQDTRQAELRVETPLLDVTAHESLLAQAISNLVDNAAKFSEPGKRPHIRIWTEAQGNQVRLWVEDDGIGIKPEHQGRIWGMFERVHPQNQYEGTGIGLAIVRKAVERMDGTLGLVSDGMTGSKFWIQLAGA
jgi:PAS domain S-box-containing protein